VLGLPVNKKGRHYSLIECIVISGCLFVYTFFTFSKYVAGSQLVSRHEGKPSRLQRYPVPGYLYPSISLEKSAMVQDVSGRS
jgi:hypothetical protein